MQLRRSALFMPAQNVRALEKARSLPIDALIADLEDAVSPAQKDHARDVARDALATGGFGHREVLVRVNGSDTPWHHDDVAAFAGLPIQGLVLPKTESKAQVQALGHTMDRLGYAPDVALWLMAETPTGVLHLQEWAAAHPRVSTLVMGTSDLSKCLRTPPHPQRIGLLWALSQAVMVARAAGLTVLDGVYLDLHNAAGFDAECAQGRALGFDGKTLIHPNQIEAAHRHFSPTEEDIQRAQRIVAAWHTATARGEGLCVLDDRLVEHLHVEEAERLLAVAEALALRETEA